MVATACTELPDYSLKLHSLSPGPPQRRFRVSREVLLDKRQVRAVVLSWVVATIARVFAVNTTLGDISRLTVVVGW